jgi:hypothetical protein
VALDALGEVQQAQSLADPLGRHLHLLGDLLVGGQLELLGDRLEAVGGIDRVEILAVEVLDQRGLTRTIALVEGDRDALQSGEFRGLEAAMAGDHGDPAVLPCPDQERLDDAFLVEAGREAIERVGGLMGAGVEALLDVDLVDLDPWGRCLVHLGLLGALGPALCGSRCPRPARGQRAKIGVPASAEEASSPSCLSAVESFLAPPAGSRAARGSEPSRRGERLCPDRPQHFEAPGSAPTSGSRTFPDDSDPGDPAGSIRPAPATASQRAYCFG